MALSLLSSFAVVVLLVGRLVEGRLFKEHDVEVKNLKSEDNVISASTVRQIIKSGNLEDL